MKKTLVEQYNVMEIAREVKGRLEFSDCCAIVIFRVFGIIEI
jgi:hypothetical protein